MTDTGKLDQRQIRVTKDGAKLIEGHRETPEILRRAALVPKVHQNIWQEFGPFSGETMPTDATLRHYLLFDHQPPFNATAVDGFLKEFCQTIKFGGVGLQDHISENDEDGNGNREGVDDPPPPPPPSFKMKQDTFTLSEGDVVLQWPSGLSKESAEDIEDWLMLVLRKIKRSADEAKVVEQEPDDGSDLI